MVTDDPSIQGPRRAPPKRPAALALVAALLGFLLATQFQAREGLRNRLAGEREEDLAQILADLGAASDRIQDEIVEIRIRLQGVRGSAEQERVLIEDAESRLDAVRILLGLVPVKGQGIVATISDPQGAVGPEVLLDAVQELRDAGAEAIEVNQVRIVASSAFQGTPGSVSISGRQINGPFEIVAVGGRDTLEEALRIPGGLADSVDVIQGASISIQQRDALKIASLHPAPRFTYATAT